MLRRASDADFDFLRGFSREPADATLRAQIRDGRIRIIDAGDVPAGFIKFYVLWETLPFLEVIIVLREHRGRGMGRKAVRHWEREMSACGFPRVLTSTRSDETAQHFWRRIGYVDCGSLRLPGIPVELLMFREIANPA